MIEIQRSPKGWQGELRFLGLWLSRQPLWYQLYHKTAAVSVAITVRCPPSRLAGNMRSRRLLGRGGRRRPRSLFAQPRAHDVEDDDAQACRQHQPARADVQAFEIDIECRFQDHQWRDTKGNADTDRLGCEG